MTSGDSMASKLSAAIRAGLVLKGINQAALSAELGVSENTVSRWVKDKCLPDRESIFHLKDFFGWDDRRLGQLLEDWYENNEAEADYRVAGAEYVRWRYENDYLRFLDDLIRLDYETIDGLDPLDEGTAPQWAPIFHNSSENWRVILHRDEIVGYWLFAFLKEEHFAKARSGELRDSMITLDALDFALSPGEYLGYFVMFSLRKDHQKSRAFDCLMKSLAGTVTELAKHDRFFKSISVHAFTKLDENICETLGMKPDGEHQSGAGGVVRRYLLTGKEVANSYFARNHLVRSKYRQRFGTAV